PLHRHGPRRAPLAEAAVAARLRSHLAEVGDEGVGLAAAVHDEAEDLADASDLARLAPAEPRHEACRDRLGAGRGAEAAVGLAKVRRLELEPPDVLEVEEHPQDALARLAEHRARVGRREPVPATPLPGSAEDPAHELPTLAAEVLDHVRHRHARAKV